MRTLLNRRVGSNLAALIVLQGGNYLLPLLLVPFLARALGLETFGTLAFATAIASICRTFVSYGFDLTATRAAAQNRDDHRVLSSLLSTVVVVRLCILGLCAIAVIVGSAIVSAPPDVALLSALSLSVLIGEALFPVWLYQGKEQMGTVTLIRLAYRASFVFATIVVVRHPADVFWVPILEGVGSLIAGMIACALAFRRYGLFVVAPSWTDAWRETSASTSVFLSTAFVHMYTTVNSVLLGVTHGSVAVAQFTAADKIYSAVRGMLGPPIQAVYPALAKLHSDDATLFRRTSVNLILLFVLGVCALGICLLVTSEPLVRLVLGVHDNTATTVLQILGVAMFFAVGSLLAPLLVVQAKQVTLTLCTLATAVIGLLAAIIMTIPFGPIGAATAFLVSQASNAVILTFANQDIWRSSARQERNETHTTP